MNEELLKVDYNDNYKNIVNYFEVQEWMKDRYNEFNTIYFENILPTSDMIIFEPVIKNVKYIGQATNSIPYKIKLNFAYDLVTIEWMNVLLHEMIHIWQYVMGYSGGHGKTFMKKAKEINKYGWNITIKHKNIYELRYARDKR